MFQSLSRHSSDAHVTGAESGGLIDEEVKTVAMEFPFKTEGSAFAPCTALTMMMMSFGMVLATTWQSIKKPGYWREQLSSGLTAEFH